MVQCPICGKDCKNAFYLGRHVSQKTDQKHVYNNDSSNSKPDLSDSIADSSGPTQENSVTPGDDNVTSPGTSQTVQWETEETNDNWRDLDPENAMENDLIAQGFTEVNMETEEVR